MKIENELFYSAKKDKGLTAFLLLDRPTEPKTIRLCIDVKNKYNSDVERATLTN